MHTSFGGLLAAAAPTVLNLIVLVGGLLWLAKVKERLSPLAIRLLGAGISLLLTNLVGYAMFNLSVSEAVGPGSWRVEQIVLIGLLSTLLHAAGLGFVIAAALVRRPAGPILADETAADETPAEEF